MKFIPILFSTPMVQAILEGRKTITRRVMKPQPSEKVVRFANDSPYNDCPQWAAIGPEEVASDWNDGRIYSAHKCPYGQPGDVLWVREALIADHNTSDTVVLSKYKADDVPVLYCTGDNYNGSVRHWDYKYDTLPSIHMPKSACRIFLEVTDVRVERLQDITEDDAMAEGVYKEDYYTIPKDGIPYSTFTYKEAFQTLWQKINGPESWESNPWVWVISFKRINKPDNF